MAAIQSALSPEEMPFQPTHIIKLSELSAEERERYFELYASLPFGEKGCNRRLRFCIVAPPVSRRLISQDAVFHKDDEGRQVADVRILVRTQNFPLVSYLKPWGIRSFRPRTSKSKPRRKRAKEAQGSNRVALRAIELSGLHPRPQRSVMVPTPAVNTYVRIASC